MPIEIKEVVIRAVTTLEQPAVERMASNQATIEDREALIQECVRQVLRILKKQEER